MLPLVDGEQQIASPALNKIGVGPAAHRLIAGLLLAMPANGVIRDLARQKRSVASSMETSTNCPLPVCVRWNSALETPKRAVEARQHVADRKARAGRGPLSA